LFSKETRSLIKMHIEISEL